MVSRLHRKARTVIAGGMAAAILTGGILAAPGVVQAARPPLPLLAAFLFPLQPRT